MTMWAPEWVVSPNARRLPLAPRTESRTMLLLLADPNGMGALMAATLGGRLRPIERFLSSENGSLMKLDRLRSFSRPPTRSSLPPDRCPRSEMVVVEAVGELLGKAGTGGRCACENEEVDRGDSRLVTGRREGMGMGEDGARVGNGGE